MDEAGGGGWWPRRVNPRLRAVGREARLRGLAETGARGGGGWGAGEMGEDVGIFVRLLVLRRDRG